MAAVSSGVALGVLALIVVLAVMTGFEEVPAVSTGATGEFRARINNDETEIFYELSYSGLEGAVTQAHIHLGQPAVNGGIGAFLCTNVGGPAGTQPCPPSPATITGTITASDIIGPAAQGIAPGEFAELVRAIRAGATRVGDEPFFKRTAGN